MKKFDSNLPKIICPKCNHEIRLMVRRSTHHHDNRNNPEYDDWLKLPSVINWDGLALCENCSSIIGTMTST